MSPTVTIEPIDRGSAEQKPRACVVSQDAILAKEIVAASANILNVDIKYGLSELIKEPFLLHALYVVDTRVRDIDLWPAAYGKFPDSPFLTWLLLASREPDPICAQFLPADISFMDSRGATAGEIVSTILEKLQHEGERHVRAVRHVPEANMIAVRLATNKTYLLPVSDLDEADNSPITRVEIGEDDSYFVVTQSSGNLFEVPWDDVLYHCERTYPYYKYKPESPEQDNARMGDRIREARKKRRLTITTLAELADMKRPNLSRLEHGKHRPSLDTLERIAEALDMPLAELVRRT